MRTQSPCTVSPWAGEVQIADLPEVGFILLLLAGVALVYLPAALILAGALGVVACERASSRREQRSATVDPRSERPA